MDDNEEQTGCLTTMIISAAIGGIAMLVLLSLVLPHLNM